MQYIYVIRNIINTMIYVGKTSNACKRKADHWYCARKGDTRPLYEAMRQLGLTNFSFEVIEECQSEDVAVEREKHWITHFDSFNNGYNLTPSGGFHVGNRGRKFSEEHKRKLSEAHRGKIVSQDTRDKISVNSTLRRGEKHPMFGKHFSDAARENMREARRKFMASPEGDEYRAKIRATLSGRKLPDETKRKISEAGRGRKHSPETIKKMKTHIFTEEHRRKLSEAARRREDRKRLERD
jgi:group I intron endonuclease